jgi:hypothetical protein
MVQKGLSCLGVGKRCVSRLRLDLERLERALVPLANLPKRDIVSESRQAASNKRERQTELTRGWLMTFSGRKLRIWSVSRLVARERAT